MWLIPVLAICIISAGLLGLSASLPKDRHLSAYAPGDCLRTPVYDPAKGRERWEEPPPFTELVMVTEVGNEKYRLRGWGGQRNTKPQWYNKYESLLFRALDNTKQWMRVPCPEEGPDEDSSGEILVFDSDTGSFASIADGTTLRNNVLVRGE